MADEPRDKGQQREQQPDGREASPRSARRRTGSGPADPGLTTTTTTTHCTALRPQPALRWCLGPAWQWPLGCFAISPAKPGRPLSIFAQYYGRSLGSFRGRSARSWEKRKRHCARMMNRTACNAPQGTCEDAGGAGPMKLDYQHLGLSHGRRGLRRLECACVWGAGLEMRPRRPGVSLWGTDGASSSADAVKLRRSASGVDIGRLLLRRRAKDL